MSRQVALLTAMALVVLGVWGWRRPAEPPSGQPLVVAPPSVAAPALPASVEQAAQAAPLPPPDMVEPTGVAPTDHRVVRGVVVDGKGEPVFAQVDACSFAQDGTITTTGLRKTGANGRFEVRLRADGTYALRAKGTSKPFNTNPWAWEIPRFDLGTGVSERFEIGPGAPAPFQTLVVSGPGVLRGRLVDDRGEPAAGVPLEASRVRPLGRSPEVWLAGQDAGNSWAESETDLEGRFEFRGLADAAYRVSTMRLDPTGDVGLVLTDEPVRADGQPLELELSRTHLVVQLADDAGRPWEVSAGQRGLFGGRALGAWPDRPELYVSLTGESARQLGRPWALPSAKELGPGVFVVEVPDGSDVVVGVRGGERRWAPRLVEFAPGTWRAAVQLTAPVRHPTGTLTCSFGRGGVLAGFVSVEVLDAHGVVIARRKVDLSKHAQVRVDVPAGEFVLVVRGTSDVEPMHGGLMKARTLGGLESRFVVTAGGETELDVRLSAGARFDVRLVGSVPRSFHESLAAEWSARAVLFDDRMVEHGATRVWLRLERPGRPPESVMFQDRAALLGRLEAHLKMGTAATSELLSPGTYELVAEAADGRVVRRPVTLRPGETTEVTLRFE